MAGFKAGSKGYNRREGAQETHGAKEVAPARAAKASERARKRIGTLSQGRAIFYTHRRKVITLEREQSFGGNQMEHRSADQNNDGR